MCSLFFGRGQDDNAATDLKIPQSQIEFPARRTIFRRHETMDCVPIVCDGWATATMALSSGRQQILSFILPGEMVTGRLVFDPQLHVSIDAITGGSYRAYDRAQLRIAMAGSQSIFGNILSAFNAENARADQLIATLGRRTAAERVACLLVDLWDRLTKLQMVQGDSVEFPLRHSHIADATGLTSVYVNTVLREFRHAGVVTISGRLLRIFDIAKLRRLTL